MRLAATLPSIEIPNVRRSAMIALAILPTLATASPPGATMPDGLQVGVLAYHYKYKEPGLMQLEGPKFGVRALYGQTDDSGKHGRVEVTGSYGQVDYRSVRTGASPDLDDMTLELRALFGVDFAAAGGSGVMPYAGLGYRYLYNDARGINITNGTIFVGYRRESNYLYLPLGVMARHGAFLANAEVDVLLRGRQKSYMSDVDPGDNDIKNKQKGGWGARLGLMFDAGKFSIGPWINYWRIKESDWVPINATTIGREPRNWTVESGLELRFRF